MITAHRKNDQGSWVSEDLDKLTDVLKIDSIAFAADLKQIYARTHLKAGTKLPALIRT